MAQVYDIRIHACPPLLAALGSMAHVHRLVRRYGWCCVGSGRPAEPLDPRFLFHTGSFWSLLCFSQSLCSTGLPHGLRNDGCVLLAGISNPLPGWLPSRGEGAYLPSLGICLLVGALQEGLIDVIVVNGNYFFGSPSRVTSLLIAAVVVVPAVPLTVMTIHRSADWADQVKLWELAVVVNPYNHNTYFSLGEAIKDDPHRKNDSEYYLREAIAIEPDFYRAWNNLGTLLYQTQRYEEAESALSRALAYIPADSAPYVPAFVLTNIGNVRFYMGQLKRAEEGYRAANDAWPANKDANCNLAVLLKHLGRDRESAAQLDILSRFHPDHRIHCERNVASTQRGVPQRR